MNQTKRTLLPGLSLFLCFCLLTGAEKLIEHYNLPPSLMALGEIVCFGLALALALAGMDRAGFRQRLGFKMPRKGGWLLILFMGMATAFAALGVNLVQYKLLAHTGLNLTLTCLPMPVSGLSFAWRLLIGVVLAALFEEIYLRGAVQSAEEQTVGTSACLLVGGLVFALLHGGLLDLAAGFLAGIAFAYLTYVLDSVWAAVLAHAVAALVTVAMQWVADTYAPFGIWGILLPLVALLFLLTAFLTLHVLEKMLVRGAIPRFEPSAGWYDLWLLLRDPGVLLLVLAFIGKLVMNYWIG